MTPRRDKAGAYGIQGRGAALVRRVEGDVLGAAGLPLNRLCRELAAIFPPGPAPSPDPGVTPWVTPDPGRGGPGTAGGGEEGGSDVTAGGGASQGAESAGGGASWLLPGPGHAPAPPPARAVSAWFVTRTGFPAGLMEVMDGVTDAEVRGGAGAGGRGEATPTGPGRRVGGRTRPFPVSLTYFRVSPATSR